MEAAQILDGIILQMQSELHEMVEKSRKAGMHENPVFRATLNKVIDRRIGEINKLKEVYHSIQLTEE